MNNQRRINIIGGGISGLSLALSLKNNGIDYNLYERNSQIKYENVGLGISANVFPILEKWGILEETKCLGAEIKQLLFVDQYMNCIKSFIIDKPPLSVNRRLFYDLLNSKLDNNKVYLNSLKYSTDFLESEIVISAEGLPSETRKRMHPQIDIRDSNQLLWRGISKIELPEKFKNSYHDFIGNDLRFAIIDLGQNHYSWYIIKSKESIVKVTLDKDVLKEYFKDYHSVIGQVIEQSKEIYFSQIQDINPKERKNLKWFLKNNLMIGDAIHPTTPNMANGACLAIEDSYLLSNLLMDQNKSIETIFIEFQKRRTKKINTVVNQSWWLGKMLHQKSNIMDWVVSVGLKATPKWIFNKIYSNVLHRVKDY